MTDTNSQQPNANTPAAGKTFFLSKQETELLRFMTEHWQAIFSAQLSTIAAGRLGYPVSHSTQFILKNGMTEVEIRELPQVANQPQQQHPADDGVVAA